MPQVSILGHILFILYIKNLLYVCVGDVMDVVLSVCIVSYGAISVCVWEV